MSAASNELHDLVEKYFGKIRITEYHDVYDPSGLYESFLNWDEDINEPAFVYQLNNYDLFAEDEWYNWFVRYGGDTRLID